MLRLGELFARTVSGAMFGGILLWGLYGLSFFLFVVAADPSYPIVRYIVSGAALIGVLFGAVVKRAPTPQRDRLKNAALGGFLALLVLSLCSIGPTWGAAIVTAQYGAAGGALIGLAVGLANGVVLTALTRIYHYPLAHTDSYSRQVRAVSTTIAFAGSAIGILLLYYVDLIPFFDIPPQTFRLLLVPPPLIAALFAWYVSPRLAAWYEQRCS